MPKRTSSNRRVEYDDTRRTTDNDRPIRLSISVELRLVSATQGTNNNSSDSGALPIYLNPERSGDKPRRTNITYSKGFLPSVDYYYGNGKNNSIFSFVNSDQSRTSMIFTKRKPGAALLLRLPHTHTYITQFSSIIVVYYDVSVFSFVSAVSNDEIIVPRQFADIDRADVHYRKIT